MCPLKPKNGLKLGSLGVPCAGQIFDRYQRETDMYQAELPSMSRSHPLCRYNDRHCVEAAFFPDGKQWLAVQRNGRGQDAG
jgi:hypothetical protein